MEALDEAAKHKMNRSAGAIFGSGALGGCLLGFGGMMSFVVAGGCMEALPPGLLALTAGMVFPIGLSMIVFSGADLWTSNIMYSTMPFLSQKWVATKESIARLYVASTAGNLVGSLALAAFAVASIGHAPGVEEFASALALKKVSNPFALTFVKAIAANWLVNIAIYMSTAAKTPGGKLAAVWLPICTFVTLGMEHAIANMFTIPFAMMSGAPITLSDFLLSNMAPVLAGNFVGGALCFATWHYMNTNGYSRK